MHPGFHALILLKYIAAIEELANVSANEMFKEEFAPRVFIHVFADVQDEIVKNAQKFTILDTLIKLCFCD